LIPILGASKVQQGYQRRCFTRQAAFISAFTLDIALGNGFFGHAFISFIVSKLMVLQVPFSLHNPSI